MEHTKHLWRAIILMLLAIVLYIVGRVVVVDFLYPTFGEYGPYRGESLNEEASRQVKHGPGMAACADCHEQRVGNFKESAHAPIDCETCHAPLITHVRFDDLAGFLADPGGYKRTAPMRIRHARDLCVRCHEAQPAKPPGFPQVVVVDHLKEMDVVNSADVCLDCHDPHDPAL